MIDYNRLEQIRQKRISGNAPSQPMQPVAEAITPRASFKDMLKTDKPTNEPIAPEQAKTSDTQMRLNSMIASRELKAKGLPQRMLETRINKDLERGRDVLETAKGIGTSVVNRFKKMGSEVQEAATSDKVELSAFGAAPTAVIGSVGDVVGELVIGAGKILLPQDVEDAIKGKTQEIGQDISETDLAQNIASKWNDLPEETKELLVQTGTVGETLLDITGVGIGGKAIKAGAKGIGKGVDKTIDAVAGLAVPKIGIKTPSMAEALDTTIEGAAKVAGGIQKVPEKIGEAVKGSVTRNLIRAAQETPDKAKTKIVDLYKRGIVPGVKKKKKTIANIKDIEQSVERVVPKIAQKYDPQNIEDFANAIDLEKKAIYSQIEEGLGKANGKIDTTNIVNELTDVLKSERAEFSPDLTRSIQSTLNNLVDANGKPKAISPNGAQQMIADTHAELQSFYRGSTSGTNADVVVKNLMLNNLKKDLDDLVEKAGGTFKGLKSEYADLKKLEDDVVHRAVFEAQKGGGLAGVTDILSAGDIIGGTIGADPAFLARGIGQYFTKEVIQSLNDKDELIRQMFILGKNLPSDASPKLAPKSPNPKPLKENPSQSIVPKKIPESKLNSATKAKESKLTSGPKTGNIKGMKNLETEAKKSKPLGDTLPFDYKINEVSMGSEKRFVVESSDDPLNINASSNSRSLFRTEKEAMDKINRGMKNKKSRDAVKTKTLEDNVVVAKKEKGLNDFLSTYSNLGRGRGEKVLKTTMRINGKTGARYKLIEDLVSDGYTPYSYDGKNFLLSPSATANKGSIRGGFLREKDITKYGMDYARAIWNKANKK